MSDSIQPLNPQWKLIEHKLKRKGKKMQKVKKVSKKASNAQMGQKTITHMPSQDLRDLKEDVLKKNLLVSLSRELADDTTNSESITAKELSENKSQGSSADCLAKLNEYTDLLAQSRTQLEKKETDVTEWATKYRKRVVDMQMDVREYEKKLRKTLNKEPSKLAALIELAELNRVKRQQINSRLAKIILEHPDKTLIRVVVELVFNILQSTLWTLAMIRDFFTK